MKEALTKSPRAMRLWFDDMVVGVEIGCSLRRRKLKRLANIFVTRGFK